LRTPLKSAAYVLILALVVSTFAYFTYTYTRRVTGTSMFPTLEDGDLVVLDAVPASSITVGTVIVYDPPCSVTGFSVIHRVVGTAAVGFLTKGDNNLQTDQQAGIASGPITPDCVLGRVVFVVPYIERLASLPYGANYILAALIVLFVIYSEFWPRSGRVGRTEPAVGP